MGLYKTAFILLILACIILIWLILIELQHEQIWLLHGDAFLIPLEVPEEPAFETPEEFFQGIQKHSNDSQNVHDSQIVRSISKKYKRLLELYNSGISLENPEKIRKSFDEIFKYVNQELPEKFMDKKKKILFVVSEIRKGNTSCSVSTELDTSGNPIPVSESWILHLVWTRISDPENKANTENMKEILMTQLLDCLQNPDQKSGLLDFLTGIKPDLYCINGRIGKIMSVLCILDSDSILSEPELDVNEMNNMIYMRVSAIFSEELNKSGLQDLYSKSELSVNEQMQLDSFRKKLESKIFDIVIREFADQLPYEKLKSVIESSYAGI